MNTCDACKHWYYDDRDKIRRLGRCKRWLFGYQIHNDDVPDNGVVVEDDEGWGAFMGPKFGCVLWEATSE